MTVRPRPCTQAEEDEELGPRGALDPRLASSQQLIEEVVPLESPNHSRTPSPDLLEGMDGLDAFEHSWSHRIEVRFGLGWPHWRFRSRDTESVGESGIRTR